MQLPDLRNFDLKDKRVLVRVDFDVPLRLVDSASEQALRLVDSASEQALRLVDSASEQALRLVDSASEQALRQASERALRLSKDLQGNLQVTDSTRIENALPTINYLLSQKVKIILLSHIGRPEGKVVPDLSLEPVARKLQEFLPLINIRLQMIDDKWQMENGEVTLVENLRFNPGEEGNDLEFSKKLASLGEFYVNDAFAVSHRKHSSIVGIPKFLPHAAGLRLIQEIEILSGILEKPKKPVIVVLGGAKEDKLYYLEPFLKFADKILVGGRLPKFVKTKDERVVIAVLTSDEKDISGESISLFETEIEKAGTIILAGPMGKFEDEGSREGTKRIIQAVSDSSAYKLAGGGETEEAITQFGENNKFDWISSGGGAMLDFLADGDLPGLGVLHR
ncbi:MAG: phosphoglycerate kinase [bacterium]|nr:phosphoglycerate kinase [bacterium]